MQDATFPIPFEQVQRIAAFAALKAHKRLAGMIAREDLEAEAMVGILLGLPKWDPDRSSFKTFAANKAYWHLMDFAREQSWVPRAEVLKIKAGLRKRPKDFSSLDAIPRHGVPECRKTSADLLRCDDAEEVQTVFRRLRASDRKVLTLYYLHGLTMKQVGRRLGLSESRISQMLSGARHRFRTAHRKGVRS